MDGLVFSRISKERAIWLEGEFSLDEVWEALDSLEGDKPPGPSGYNLAFFKSCWDTVGLDMLRFFKEFYTDGSINKG